MFPKLTTAKRVQTAKQKTHRVVDHLLYLLALHESNAIVVHSDTLSMQIPRSYAANAFNLFRQCMSHFEIVRLCALWDPPSPDRESIPTIVKLLKDHPDVIDALVEETRTTALVGVRDPALAELSPSIEEQAQRKTAEARDEIERCIRKGQEIEHSPPLASVKNVRDKHLAHSLSKTVAKKRPVLPVNPGDERQPASRLDPIGTGALSVGEGGEQRLLVRRQPQESSEER